MADVEATDGDGDDDDDETMRLRTATITSGAFNRNSLRAFFDWPEFKHNAGFLRFNTTTGFVGFRSRLQTAIFGQRALKVLRCSRLPRPENLGHA